MTDKPKRPAPKSVRMKPEERRLLALRAAEFGLSENAYLVWCALYRETPPPRSRGKAPVKDHQAIAAVLAKIGNSRIAGNINQLAKAANSGSLVLTPEIAAELRQAAADIAEIRHLVLKGLGRIDAAPASDAP